MGSPIPSLQEGAWTREGPKVVEWGYESMVPVDLFDLEPWKDMVTSHSLAGRLVLSLGTRTCQPVLRGRQATAPSTPWWPGGGSHPSMWVRFGMVRQVGWTPAECGLTEFRLRFVPLLFMQRGVRYTSLVGCWHGSGCRSIVVPRPPWWLGRKWMGNGA